MFKRLDPNLVLLFAGMVLFGMALVGVEYFFKDDGQVFQVFATLVSGFSASFFTVIKQKTSAPAETPPPSTPEGSEVR